MFPIFADFNERIRVPGGFHLTSTARERSVGDAVRHDTANYTPSFKSVPVRIVASQAA